ncbi:MAG TPA: low temperature requirement protein A [Actinomycetes bacterium]|nr:low temperature requirement protein A [Actinomycetes bacterium]
MTESPHEGQAEEQQEEQEEYGVSPLELFFDLVFVFALTQVTTLMADDLTWLGLLRGVGVLTAVWWAWVGYSWLTNALRVDDDVRARIVILCSMAAMLVAALAIPHAFDDDGVLFGFAYFVVTILFLVLYLVATRHQHERKMAVLRLAPGVLAAPILIVIAGFFDAGVVRALLWTIALGVSLASPLIAGTSAWAVRPGHFAERHGLIVIIALGESLVALGLAASGQTLTTGVVISGVMGFAIVAAMWWLYFDVVALVGERILHELDGQERNVMARDSYSYLHLPVVIGIIMVALGLKESLTYDADEMGIVTVVALFGGMALYLFAHVAFRLRNVHSVSRQRLVVACALLVLIPVATHISAYATLVILTSLSCGLVAFEVVKFRAPRDSIRHEHMGRQQT